MDELTAPQQNRLLAGLSNLLRRVEQDSGPEFLPRGLDVMGLVRQLALPSAETVEKMSYGDPLFRMPTQSNIPITTDRGYLAEVLGLVPAASAASRATTRLSNEAADALVRQITGRSDATAMRALEEIGQMSPVPQVMSGSRDLIRSSADDLASELNSLGFQAKVQHSGSRAGPSSYVEIYDPQTGRFFTKPIRFSGHGKGPFEAAGVIDVQDPSTDIPNIVQEALQMREMGPSTVFQKQAIADELIAGGMKPKQAYAEAEQRVAGLLEPQAGARPITPIESTSFKNWFGDWQSDPQNASKIVDEQGLPMPVYHGSGSADIKEFDLANFEKVQKGDWGKGIYFSPSKWMADGYRKTAIKASDKTVQEAFDNEEKLAKSFGTKPMNKWLDLQSGKISQEQYDKLTEAEQVWRDAIKKVDESSEGKVYDAYLNIKNPYNYTYSGITEPDLALQAKRAGHDGLIIRSESGEIEEIVVFDPKQIKSASENTGEFSSETANIFRGAVPTAGAGLLGAGMYQDEQMF